jgi:type II secretory pathway component PulK
MVFVVVMLVVAVMIMMISASIKKIRISALTLVDSDKKFKNYRRC